MKEVYVVMSRIGGYDFEYTRPVLVVNTKQDAEEEVFRLNNSVRKYCKHLCCLEERIESRAEYLADKAHPDKEDYEKWDSAFDSVYDKLRGELRKKYPDLTGNYDESTSQYYYELCEFKGES